MKTNFLTAPIYVFKSGIYVKAYVGYLAAFWLGAWIF